VRILALSAVAVCLFAGSARADLAYEFNVSSLLGGSIQPFSFSFTSATFLADGDAITFPPFTVTNGVDSWTFTDGLATENGLLGCFEFGTSSDSALNQSCDVSGSPPGAAILLSVANALPTDTGTFDLQFSLLIPDSDPLGFTLLGGTLSLVPEPTSIGLLGIVLAVVGWTLRKRPTGGLL
jgi:hypothetical protein